MSLALSHCQTARSRSNQCPKQTIKLLDSGILVALSFQWDIGEAVLEVTHCSISLSFSLGAQPIPSGLKPPGNMNAASRSHRGNQVLLHHSIYMALK